MKPELIAAIAESNLAEGKRAEDTTPKEPKLDLLGDAAVQLDSLGQIADLGIVLVNGLRTAGDCIASICDAIPSID